MRLHHNNTHVMSCVHLAKLQIQYEALGLWHPYVLFAN